MPRYLVQFSKPGNVTMQADAVHRVLADTVQEAAMKAAGRCGCVPGDFDVYRDTKAAPHVGRFFYTMETGAVQGPLADRLRSNRAPATLAELLAGPDVSDQHKREHVPRATSPHVVIRPDSLAGPFAFYTGRPSRPWTCERPDAHEYPTKATAEIAARTLRERFGIAGIATEAA